MSLTGPQVRFPSVLSLPQWFSQVPCKNGIRGEGRGEKGDQVSMEPRKGRRELERVVRTSALYLTSATLWKPWPCRAK